MTKGLYMDLQNLLTSSISDQEWQISQKLDDMVIGQNDPDRAWFRASAEAAIRYHIEKRRLEKILEQFKTEVEEPC